jgi:hypothetical protein
MQCVWCFTVNIYGNTYIEVGVPYKVTCNVGQYNDNRITFYSAFISNGNKQTFIIAHATTNECYYQKVGAYVLCQPGVCSCDTDGLATHWTYSTSADLSSPVTFTCSSNVNNGILQTSEPWTPTISCKYLVFKLNIFCCC